MAWAIKATVGHGWVRDIWQGGPIITAVRAECERWPTEVEAQQALDGLPDRDGLVVVDVGDEPKWEPHNPFKG